MGAVICLHRITPTSIPSPLSLSPLQSTCISAGFTHISIGNQSVTHLSPSSHLVPPSLFPSPPSPYSLFSLHLQNGACHSLLPLSFLFAHHKFCRSLSPSLFPPLYYYSRIYVHSFIHPIRPFHPSVHPPDGWVSYSTHAVITLYPSLPSIWISSTA